MFGIAGCGSRRDSREELGPPISGQVGDACY